MVVKQMVNDRPTTDFEAAVQRPTFAKILRYRLERGVAYLPPVSFPSNRHYMIV